MKKRIVMLMFLSVLCASLFVGCTDDVEKNTQKEVTLENESELSESIEEEETEKQVLVTEDKKQEDKIELTGIDEAAYQELTELFKAEWYAKGLTSYYSKPEEMDLYQLFYNGSINSTPTQEEWDYAIAKCGGEDAYIPDMQHVVKEEMEEILTTYFGISLSQANRDELDYFLYCETTGNYLALNSDTNYPWVDFIGATQLENGDVELYYQDRDRPEDFKGIVTLHKQDGMWKIKSNLSADGQKHPTDFTD